MGVSVFILREAPVRIERGEGKILIELLKKFAEVLGTESPNRLPQQAKYHLRPKNAGRGTLAGGSRWGLKIYLREQGNHAPCTRKT